MRVLLVEDENLLRERLRIDLEAAGYSVECAADGEAGLQLGQGNAYELAVIDLGLPKLDGIELIRRLRGDGRRFPILILTARDNWSDKVEGLEAGADDYVAKPFHMEEILARLNALLRRSAGFASPVLESGPIALDTGSKQVTLNSEPVALTAFEYKLLEFLMLNPDKVVSKLELTEQLYEQDFDRDSNTIEVFVRRLRRKLDPDGQLQPIETVRGQGYRLRRIAP